MVLPPLGKAITTPIAPASIIYCLLCVVRLAPLSSSVVYVTISCDADASLLAL